MLIKFTLRRIRLNRGGYDSFGYYWGVGSPLYEAAVDIDATYEVFHFRASDRRAAKALLVSQYPHDIVSFYR